MTTREVLWFNDRMVPAGDARLDPRDRGFTLGDGLFETMRARDGVVQRPELHFGRLRAGAQVLGLHLPWTDNWLIDATTRTLTANALDEAAVRLTVSRGVPSTRGLLPEADLSPSLVIHAQHFSGYPAELYKRGMHATISSIRRNEYSPLCGIKSLCYLDNILARREAAAQGADEALLLNTAGEFACASAANLFLVLDGSEGPTVITPPTCAGALAGTMRGVVLRTLASEGINAHERPVSLEILAQAREAFLTSVLLGVMPLTGVNGAPIGTGTPGRLSLQLAAALSD